MSIASWTSPPASARTLPISRVISSVSSSLCVAQELARSGRGSRRARGAGTRRQSSNAAFAAATARSTSAAPERGNDAERLAGRGHDVSNVSPPSASTHSPPMKFSRVGAAAIAADPSVRGRRRRWRRTCPVARGAAAVALRRAARRSRLARRARVAAVGARAPVDDHRHARVVRVVGDELVEELGLELARDDAVDHGLSLRRNAARPCL